LAVEPLRQFFDLTVLGGGQLFLAMLSAAGGLVLASAVWRLPAMERLEEPDSVEPLADALGKEAADRIESDRRAAREPPTTRLASEEPEQPSVPPEPTQFEELPPRPPSEADPE
jgi:hypothetical protein